MGMVTLHLVIGVGVFILPLFLLLFREANFRHHCLRKYFTRKLSRYWNPCEAFLITMSLAHLCIVIGSVSFVASVLTTVVLITKFVNQPEAHGFFSYSDTVASALMSLGLLLDGILYLLPDHDTPCYQYKVVYGLFVVPIITGFFSVLGMAIERFQTFALFRDRRKLTKKFSIAWFAASWTLALCFLVTLLAQISEKEPVKVTLLGQHSHTHHDDRFINGNNANDNPDGNSDSSTINNANKFYVNILDMDLFPGPHREKRLQKVAEWRKKEPSVLHMKEEKENSTMTAQKLHDGKEIEAQRGWGERVLTGHNLTGVLLAKLPRLSPASVNMSGNMTSKSINIECVFRFRRSVADGTGEKKLKQRHSSHTWHSHSRRRRVVRSRWDETNVLGNVLRVIQVPNESCDPEDIQLLFNGSKAFVAEPADTQGVNSPAVVETLGTGAPAINVTKGIQCWIRSWPFIMYYLVLLFLLCFATPVLITTSLNVFIQSAVGNTTYEVISHHQWLTLASCVLMWGPSLVERLLAKWDIVSPCPVVSVFLFLLGHTHNLLRSVLHVIFAQQIHALTWQGNQLNLNVNRSCFVWGFPKENRVDPGNKDRNEWRKNKRSTSESNSADDADSRKASNSISQLDVIERADPVYKLSDELKQALSSSIYIFLEL